MKAVTPCWLFVQLFISGTVNGTVISNDYNVQARWWRRGQVSGTAVNIAHAQYATEHYVFLKVGTHL
jgi:hypothetical protein